MSDVGSLAAGAAGLAGAAAPAASGGAPGIPTLGDVALTAVQRVEHEVVAGFVDVPVLGLAGDAQQRDQRRSHRIRLQGVLHGDTAADDLGKLQSRAAGGEETTFTADITTALDLQQVVVTWFRAVEVAGSPGVVAYDLEVVESPPLPPPASLGGFGGLDDFGVGDLGFGDLGGVLGDVASLAGEVAAAVDQAISVIGDLQALSALTDLGDLGGVLQPLQDAAGEIGGAVTPVRDALDSLHTLFGGS